MNLADACSALVTLKHTSKEADEEETQQTSPLPYPGYNLLARNYSVEQLLAIKNKNQTLWGVLSFAFHAIPKANFRILFPPKADGTLTPPDIFKGLASKVEEWRAKTKRQQKYWEQQAKARIDWERAEARREKSKRCRLSERSRRLQKRSKRMRINVEKEVSSLSEVQEIATGDDDTEVPSSVPVLELQETGTEESQVPSSWPMPVVQDTVKG